jgi:hypothetical protein
VDTQLPDPIQVPTPEEVRKIHDEGVRIMGITMPHALKQIQAMYQRSPDQTHARFVHYTTAEAALSIIRTKRFWLRNTNCMSDYREVQHGFDIFNRYFLDAAKRKAFVDAFDACASGTADDAFTAFNNWWQDLRLNTYIACVSEHQDSEGVHGRLSMWRAFGGTGTRVGIVLRFPYVSISAVSLSSQFQPSRLLVRTQGSRRHRSSHRKRSGQPRLPPYAQTRSPCPASFSDVCIRRRLSQARRLSRGTRVASDLHAETLAFSPDAIFHRGCRRCPPGCLQGPVRQFGFTADRRFGFRASLRATNCRPNPIPVADLRSLRRSSQSRWSAERGRACICFEYSHSRIGSCLK